MTAVARTSNRRNVYVNLAPRTTLRVTAGVAVLIAAHAAVLLLAGGPSYGHDGPKPGGECRGQAGKVVTIQTHDGAFKYRCEQRTGENCEHWRIVPGQNPPKGNWPKHPTLPCASCSPSPSKSPSTSPSASASPSVSTSASPSTSPSKSASTSASPSKPASPSPSKSATVAASPSRSTGPNPSPSNVAVTLPVTGESNTLLLLSIASVTVGAGLGLLTFAGSRRRRTV